MNASGQNNEAFTEVLGRVYIRALISTQRQMRKVGGHFRGRALVQADSIKSADPVGMSF